MEKKDRSQRVSRPKVRTGCQTCKVRHVKCDEGKPTCRRCEKFGIKCDGYSTAKPNNEWIKKKTLLLPKDSHGVISKISSPMVRPLQAAQLLPISAYRQPSANPPFQTEREQYYFKLFQSQTARELSGYFDTDIWNLTVLQTSHAEAFAYHGVIALGALQSATECISCSSEPFLSTLSQKRQAESHHQFALQHYGKALKAMRSLPQMKDSLWRKHILLSCLLTACFENYIGDHGSALAAAQKGIVIIAQLSENLTQWKESIENPQKAVKFRSMEENDMYATFARLEAGIIRHHHDRQKPRSFSPLMLEEIAPFIGLEIPDKFETVRDARFFCDFFVLRSMIWREALLKEDTYETLEFGEVDPVAKKVKIEHFKQRVHMEFQLCVKAKAKWFKAFEPLFEKTRRFPGSKEFLGASILMIQYISSNLTAHLPSQLSETYYDQFQEDMVTIVDLSRELLEKYPYTTSKRVIFMFDDGLVVGLFLTIIRARHRRIRRQALGLLLAYPRREGLWDSWVAAKVGAWFMELEERGCEEEFIPEEKRLRITKLDMKLDERKVVVGYSKFDESLEERIEAEDVTLTW